MARSRTFVYAAVGCILAVTLVSGPLVPWVDLTRADAGEDPGELGQGDATAEVVSAPGRATLTRGAYGSGSYYLEVPDATVELRDVTGRPMLIYKIRLPAKGYSRGTNHFVSAEQEGTYELSLERDAWTRDEVTRDRYEGELVVLLRDGDSDRTVYRGNVTVEVER